jgi:hypothetical protein
MYPCHIRFIISTCAAAVDQCMRAHTRICIHPTSIIFATKPNGIVGGNIDERQFYSSCPSRTGLIYAANLLAENASPY